MDISVTEKTRIGSVRTEYEKVEAAELTLNGDTLVIKSISIAD